MKNKKHNEGCMICGQELNYLNEEIKVKCNYCGKEAVTRIVCPDQHFICDDCHRADGLKAIENICLTSDSINPIYLANQIMDIDFINMHGPEHHALVPAVLVTAYKNKTGLLTEEHIKEAIKRGAQVQGGMCGSFGACGAGIGAGIALSVINGTNPLSYEDWGLANEMTSRALHEIGLKGGPRCCKRCTWTAIETAVDFLAETNGVQLDTRTAKGQCSHFKRNKQCRGKNCHYFPGGDKNE